MSLAGDLAALCDTVRGSERGTNGCHLAAFCEDVASLCPPLPLHGYPPTLCPSTSRSVSGIGYSGKQVDILISKNQANIVRLVRNHMAS